MDSPRFFSENGDSVAQVEQAFYNDLSRDTLGSPILYVFVLIWMLRLIWNDIQAVCIVWVSVDIGRCDQLKGRLYFHMK